jgi:hypothetical protein
MHRRNLIANDDTQPVTVPRNHDGFVAMPTGRVHSLREHLIEELADLRKAKHLERFASTSASRTNWLRWPCRADRLLALQGLPLPERR